MLLHVVFILCGITTSLPLLYSVALTKIDGLDSFDEIKIGIAYKLDGKVLESFPGIVHEILTLQWLYIDRLIVKSTNN